MKIKYIKASWLLKNNIKDLEYGKTFSYEVSYNGNPVGVWDGDTAATAWDSYEDPKIGGEFESTGYYAVLNRYPR